MLHLLKVDSRETYQLPHLLGCGMWYLSSPLFRDGQRHGGVRRYVADRVEEDFGGAINIHRIPLYHFPDVWQNLIWVVGFFKFVLEVMVIVSVTNEFAYRTLRPERDRWTEPLEFLRSKILTNVVLAGLSTVLLFLVGLITGMIYSPELRFSEIIDDVGILPCLFLAGIRISFILHC